MWLSADEARVPLRFVVIDEGARAVADLIERDNATADASL
jgi:hypothetical protein